MRIVRYVVPVLTVGVVSVACQAAGYVFALRKTDAGLTIEKVDLVEGQVQVFMCTPQAGYIDIVLPVAPGGSGNVARLADQATLIARYADGAVQVTTRLANGKEWKRPPRQLDDLRDCDIRVSVTGHDGTKQAFVIAGYEEVLEDTIGPVIDMFAGAVPLQPGDYVVCTDTYRSRIDSPVYGQAPVEYSEYLFVRGRLADGTEGEFALDLGAAETVVAKAFVPGDVTIAESSVAQYSPAGKKLLSYEPEGATGKVQTFVGHATLPTLQFGGLKFADASVAVIEDLPTLAGHQVVGILGMDLLRRAEVLSLGLPGAGANTPFVRLARQADPAGGEAIELPFATVNTHTFIKSEVNGIPVALLFDTGSPDCVLDGPAAQAAGVAIKSDRPDAGGLDKGAVRVAAATVKKLRLGDRDFADVDVSVSSLPIFANLRVNDQSVGLIGNTLLAKFSRLDLDFGRRVVRLVK